MLAALGDLAPVVLEKLAPLVDFDEARTSLAGLCLPKGVSVKQSSGLSEIRDSPGGEETILAAGTCPRPMNANSPMSVHWQVIYWNPSPLPKIVI